MILCIDLNSLNVSDSLQKNVDIGDLLVNHCKYFETEEKALSSRYAPLDFMVSVRSTYTNLVLETDSTTTEGEKNYFVNISKVNVLPHKGFDLVMYLASVGLLHRVNYRIGFDDLMMKSEFIPMGLFNPDPTISDPIIYSHIIIADEVIEDFKTYLNSSSRLVPISEMKVKGTKLKPILDSIFEVKEKREDGGNYNENEKQL